MPSFAVSITMLVLWYSYLPVPIVASNIAQVELEAENGGYRLIDVETYHGEGGPDRARRPKL